MKIIERLKDAVEHTSDSLQQKLLNEFTSPDDIAGQARKIIQELVKPLEKPDQIIINDIVSLIHALASNPDSSIDMDQVLQTAEILINELVKPIDNPNKELMDQLLHIIVITAKPRKKQSQLDQRTQSTNTQVQSTNSSIQSQQMQEQSAKPALDEGMIKLLMDEMKEVIKKNQQSDIHVNELETKLTNKIITTNEEVDALKAKLKEQETKVTDILKNMDKFISLYEIVINQYNPFIEHIDANVKQTIAQPQVVATSTPVQQPKEIAPQIKEQQPTTSNSTQAQPVTASSGLFDKSGTLITDINVLVEHLKEMKAEEFTQIQPLLSQWCMQYLSDKMLAAQLQETHNQQDAVKLLLKKALKLMN